VLCCRAGGWPRARLPWLHLAGLSVASALGAVRCGVRGSWPGSVRSQSLVLLLGVTACVMLAATVPSLAWIAGALVLSGFMAADVVTGDSRGSVGRGWG
jgi:hypothetical protein